MRAVVQRCGYASVNVNGKIVGEIGKGIMLLVGFSPIDDDKSMDYILDKTVNLRIFTDDDDKMNFSLKDIYGELLIVPNFTLYGDARKGRRPGFSNACPIDKAKMLFENFIKKAEKQDLKKVKSGIFQADMKVELLNDGPVTILLDSDRLF
ncbi:MAG: D-aminoacyl-tRNA deacylase [Clostridia bacterium]|jgi:D-tyrosyl-tRNA(Tyr) deacylase|nr:D-aminoacyl-tRNA deacylase [Clostridia bacterium]MCI2015381.1 D-aminoacyl-tRNA deacylase [Clostridia bacterium]